jgi:hypothetical protein
VQAQRRLELPLEAPAVLLAGASGTGIESPCGTGAPKRLARELVIASAILTLEAHRLAGDEK